MQSLQSPCLRPDVIDPLHQAIDNRDKQLDPEQVAQTGADPSHPAASFQVLESVDHRDQSHRLSGLFGEADNRLKRRAITRGLGGNDCLETRGHGYVLTVEGHNPVTEGLGSVGGGVENPAQPARGMDRDHGLRAGGKSGVIGRLKRMRGGRGRLGGPRQGRETSIELGPGQPKAVLECRPIQGQEGRHDADSE